MLPHSVFSSNDHQEQNRERKVKVKRAEIRRMNVRLNVGRLGNIGKRMRTAGGCMVFLGMVAGFTGFAVAAENTAATRTALAVSTDNAGLRTRVTLTAHVSADETGAPSGVVNFRSGEMDLGSAFLDGEGNAALQTDNLPAGSHQLVAIYQGVTGYAHSLSTPAQIQANVSTVAGFTVAATPTSLSTPVGGFVSSVVTVTPVNGFNAYVSLSCSGLPVNTTCNFTPLSVLASCTTSAAGAQTCTPGTSVMQIQTLAPSPGPRSGNAADTGMGSYAFVFPALFGLVGLGACKRRAWRNLALGVLALAGAMSMTACAQRYKYLNHGPPGNTGTPTGNYTVTVDAQSSNGAFTVTPPTQPQLTLVITN
jgi:Bacterial Ig-like domain (group 3)